MSSQHVENAGLQKIQSSIDTSLSEKPIVGVEKLSSPAYDDNEAKHRDAGDTIQYPEPWKYEKWFIGGYSQKRMMKFKRPKSMYTAINLFAGQSIAPYSQLRTALLTLVTSQELLSCSTGTIRV